MGSHGARIAVYRKMWRRMGKLYYILTLLGICKEDVLYFEHEVDTRMPAWLGRGWLKRAMKKGKR